jgi:hypothetical protein
MAPITEDLPLLTTDALLRECLDGRDKPKVRPSRAGGVSAHEPDERAASAPLDLPAVAGAFSRRLHDAGMPVTPSHSEQYARSLALIEPASRDALYWTTRAIFVTGPRQVPTFDRVFRDIFDSAGATAFASP